MQAQVDTILEFIDPYRESMYSFKEEYKKWTHRWFVARVVYLIVCIILCISFTAVRLSTPKLDAQYASIFKFWLGDVGAIQILGVAAVSIFKSLLIGLIINTLFKVIEVPGMFD